MSSGSRVGINAAASTTAQVLTLLLGMLTTPVILHSLGPTEFGAYALVGSLTAYFGLLDLGIGGSLTRFMAFHHQRDDRIRVGAFASLGLLFYLAMALVGQPASLWAAPAVARFLALPPEVQHDFPVLLATVFALYLGWSLNGVVVARLTAVHRLDLTALCSVCGAAVMAAGIFVLVPRYPSIATVFACLAAQLVTVASMLLAIDRRLNGPLLSMPWRLGRNEARQLLSFGLWSQLGAVTAVINLEADKVIISRGIGVEQVTPYHVANRLALLSRMLPLQLLGSLLPEVTARVSAGASPADLEKLYADASRGLMIPTLLVGGFVAGAADALLRLWLKTDLPGAAGLCIALVASYAVNNLTGAGTTIIRAEGRPQLETFYGVLSTVLNIGLTVLLIRPYGLNGVVMGTIGGNVIGSIVFVVLFHRRKRFSWWSTQGCWLLPLAGVTVVTAVLSAALLAWLVPYTLGPLALGGALGVTGLAYVAAFVLLGQGLGLWTAADRAFVSRLLAKLPFRRKLMRA